MRSLLVVFLVRPASNQNKRRDALDLGWVSVLHTSRKAAATTHFITGLIMPLQRRPRVLINLMQRRDELAISLIWRKDCGKFDGHGLYMKWMNVGCYLGATGSFCTLLAERSLWCTRPLYEANESRLLSLCYRKHLYSTCGISDMHPNNLHNTNKSGEFLATHCGTIGAHNRYKKQRKARCYLCVTENVWAPLTKSMTFIQKN